MPETPWRTSVTELVFLFRDALRAIIVPLERAHIPWKSPDAYDQWDTIATTLWEQIVIDAIHYAIGEHVSLVVPKYGLTYGSYAGFSFVEVRLNRGETANLALVALGNSSPDFADVRCDALDASGTRVATSSNPIDGSAFVFCHRQANGSLVEWTDLKID